MPTSSVDADLVSFLGEAKSQGLSDEFTVSLLEHNGWSQRRIYRAFSAYYARQFASPMPTRAGGAEAARDAFFYLLNFITLSFWTIALGQIGYIAIAHAFPDAAAPATYQSLRDQISWQLATVLVTFPIFVLVHSRIRRELSQRPDLYDSGVRKWLTYLALVLAALVVLSDGVWFVQALLRGELTIRFLLDSIVLLVLGGGIFGYYLLTIDPPAAQA